MRTNLHPRKAGFTLIELMAVVTIIIILAGLVVGGIGYVSERQAKEKARVQIALLSKAIEEYKLDNGRYPPTGNSTTGLQSATLFNYLYWDSDNDTKGVGADDDQKIYLPELDPGTTQSPNKQGWTSGTAAAGIKIMDPWGFEYRYRSAFAANGTANADTQNPDFDLWSSGKNGTTKAAKNDSPSATENKDDVRNF